MDREKVVTRIFSRHTRCRIDGITYLIYPPTADQKYVAQELADEAYEEAVSRGVMTNETALSILRRENLWTDEKQSMLDVLPRQCEDFKVALFNSTFKSNEHDVIRKALRRAEQEIDSLRRDLHRWDYLTAEGLASQLKFNFGLLRNVRRTDGTELFCDESFWDKPSPLLESFINVYHSNFLGEAEYRELARNEPWRSYWGLAGDASKLFGVPVMELTDEQRSLCVWSKMYDDIRGHSDCPNQATIDDDDMLDGWIIIQNRKRESEDNTREVESRIGNNPKIQNADEIFIVAGSQQDAQKIYNANSMGAKTLVRQRLEKIQREKIVNEVDMPDTQMKVRMALANGR